LKWGGRAREDGLRCDLMCAAALFRCLLGVENASCDALRQKGKGSTCGADVGAGNDVVWGEERGDARRAGGAGDDKKKKRRKREDNVEEKEGMTDTRQETIGR